MQPRGLNSINISRDQLFSMSVLARQAIEKAMHALNQKDTLLARQVIESDKAINSYEIDIDNSTFHFLALTAKDLPDDLLRFSLSIQKINAMLERIGDHAVNIAESAETWSRRFKDLSLYELPKMGILTMSAYSDAQDCFFEKDAELAKEVLTRDDEIDRMNIGITDAVKADVMNGRLPFEAALEIIRVSKNLERIADLSSNIAEEALFTIGGTIIKHHVAEQEMRPIEYDTIRTNANMLLVG